MGWRVGSIGKGLKDLLRVIKYFYLDGGRGFTDVYICETNHIVNCKRFVYFNYTSLKLFKKSHFVLR